MRKMKNAEKTIKTSPNFIILFYIHATALSGY